MATTHLDRESIPQGSVHMDAIRGLAALIVFVSHTRSLYFSSGLPASVPGETIGAVKEPPALGMLQGKVNFSNEAVILFFALSGYLVGGSVLRALRGARWSWKTYLSKRLTRLWLVLVPAIVLGVALDHLGIRFFGHGSIYDTSAAIPLSDMSNVAPRLRPSVILGNLFFVQTILVQPLGTNLALWSLASEFWYYMIFPLGVIAALPSSRRTTRVWSGIGAAVLLLFAGWRIAAFFPVWILGALIEVMPKRSTAEASRRYAGLLTGLLLATMLSVRVAGLDVIPALTLIGVVACGLIYFLTQMRTPSRRGIYRRVAGYFSHISYSLYSFHLPLAVFLCGWMNHPWHLWPKTPRNLGIWVGSDLFLLMAVTGLWHLFEARTDAVRAWMFREGAARRQGSVEPVGATGSGALAGGSSMDAAGQ
jgi:peptidoglycan/LPS O-acetylase OafA/YrhL